MRPTVCPTTMGATGRDVGLSQDSPDVSQLGVNYSGFFGLPARQTRGADQCHHLAS
jgi:hypothetical protein